MHLRAALLAVVTLGFVSGASALGDPSLRADDESGTVNSQRSGITYDSWEAYYRSEEFRLAGIRCGTRPDPEAQVTLLNPTAADCTFSLTNPRDIYDGPTGVVYRIPVVFHIIQRTNGTGNIPDQRIIDQVRILNEDFNALPNTPGAPGTNARIEFYLATTDPNGNPTTGITRSTNNTWFNDGGSYWNTLAWDTNRYVNVYSNSAGGNLGYVPDLPQGGLAGQARDRVVVYWESVGVNPSYAPYGLGRTLTHEIGHYLGLYHPFDNGCGTNTPPGCYSTGDMICDVRNMSQPNFGCTANTQCGGISPIANYMNYSDDACMNQFSPEQVRRMRCSLLGYRPNVFSVAPEAPASDFWSVQ